MIRFKVIHDFITLFINPRKSLKMEVEKAVLVGVSGELYQGSYEVIPTIDGNTLKTKGKYMNEDVIVRPIPYSEIPNKAGGVTVIIGR